jgi:PTS IIA-like nitrogen-regulatory protein ptsN
MTLLANILPLSNIVLDMEVGSKKRLFETVSQLLEANSGLPHTAVFDCLFAREKLGSTGLGQGVAIPHGRDESFTQPVGAFVRTADPIEFDAPDGKPVSLVFVLLVPQDAAGEYLELLSQLAARFHEKTVREALMHSETPQQVLDILLAGD